MLCTFVITFISHFTILSVHRSSSIEHSWLRCTWKWESRMMKMKMPEMRTDTQKARYREGEARDTEKDRIKLIQKFIAFHYNLWNIFVPQFVIFSIYCRALVLSSSHLSEFWVSAFGYKCISFTLHRLIEFHSVFMLSFYFIFSFRSDFMSVRQS